MGSMHLALIYCLHELAPRSLDPEVLAQYSLCPELKLILIEADWANSG